MIFFFATKNKKQQRTLVLAFFQLLWNFVIKIDVGKAAAANLIFIFYRQTVAVQEKFINRKRKEKPGARDDIAGRGKYWNFLIEAEKEIQFKVWVKNNF